MTRATRPVAFVLCALMLSIAPTAAQKITIDEVTKPYDAKTLPTPPSSGQMDRQLVVLALGVLGVLITGPAIYLFPPGRHKTARDGDPQTERDGDPQTERDRDPQTERDRDPQTERDFHNVFRTASPEGKEAVIKRWMDRQKCGRLEAMRLAVEQWRWDNR